METQKRRSFSPSASRLVGDQHGSVFALYSVTASDLASNDRVAGVVYRSRRKGRLYFSLGAAGLYSLAFLIRVCGGEAAQVTACACRALCHPSLTKLL